LARFIYAILQNTWAGAPRRQRGTSERRCERTPLLGKGSHAKTAVNRRHARFESRRVKEVEKMLGHLLRLAKGSAAWEEYARFNRRDKFAPVGVGEGKGDAEGRKRDKILTLRAGEKKK